MKLQKFCVLFLSIIFINISLFAQDLKVEEIMAKHQAAIAPAEKRKDLKNMMLLGYSLFKSKLPERKTVGKVAIVSNADNQLFISSFAAENYPFEKIGYFKGDVVIPIVNQGIRSPLGDFLQEHSDLLKSGVFSGAMSHRWIFLKDEFKEKFKLNGTKKIDGRKAYVVNYYPSGASDLFTVRLYFDAENFQHIRSDYREIFPTKEAVFGKFNQVNDSVVEVSETFAEYKNFEGVNLPTILRVHYQSSTSKGVFEYDWTFQVNEVKFNQDLKPDFFKF